MKFNFFKLAIGASVLIAASAAQADELVTNGDFEIGSFNGLMNPEAPQNHMMQLTAGATDLTGWTITANQAPDIAWLEDGNHYGVVASSGNKHVDLTGWSNVYQTASISQSLSTVAGNTYHLTFDVGVKNDGTGLGQPTTIRASIDGNGILDAVDTNPAGPNEVWDTYSVDFVAASSSSTLSFEGIAGTYYTGLDNIHVSTVPEPCSMAALALGGVALLRRKFKRA